jgi:CelD/BcsL family acetyltransferase involved in cellulose biosynthesis
MSTIEVHDSVDDIAQEWDELADRARAAPYLRPGWMGAWWRCFGEGRLVVVALRGRDGLDAVLPLEARGRDLCSLSNDETPRFGPVVADWAAEQELGGALFDRAGRSVRLGWLSAEDAATLAVAAVKGSYRTSTALSSATPFVALSGDWETYLGRMKSDRRRSLRRRRRRLEEMGEVTLDIRDGTEQLGATLKEFIQIEGSGWKGEAGTAIRLQPKLTAFYTSITRWAADRGELRMAFLRVDGRPIAAHLYLQSSEVLYRFKSGYDEDWSKQAPGLLLTGAMLERAFEENLTLYDFLGGGESHKLDWMADARPLVRLHAYERGSLAGRALHGYETVGRPLAKRAVQRVRTLRPDSPEQSRRTASAP